MLEIEIGTLLRTRGWRLAVAESCTGGLLGYRITTIAGSSDYFAGGLITYSNEAKMALLGVQEESLRLWGAVSPQVALEMAAGARRQLNVELALSVTGIAGPGGGTPLKPVGLVYIGLATPGERWAWRHQWSGDRTANQISSAEAALEHLKTYLQPE